MSQNLFEDELRELDLNTGSSDVAAKEQAEAAILARMRDQAANASERLEAWARALDPARKEDAIRLMEVYEALAPDCRTHERFFLAELNRVLSECEAHPSSKVAFDVVGAFMFLEPHAPESLRSALRQRLSTGLVSSTVSVRRACVDLIGGYDLSGDPEIRSAVEACLRDKDWRVRAMAESTLSENNLLPPDYRPPLVDRLLRKIRPWANYV